MLRLLVVLLLVLPAFSWGGNVGFELTPYCITLPDAMPNQQPLEIYVTSAVDAFNGRNENRAAFALSPRYNKAVHEVDASGLKFVEGVPRGQVKVTIQPDGWLPRDGKPLAGEIHFTMISGELTYTGNVGARTLKGVATVTTLPRIVLPKHASIDLLRAIPLGGDKPSNVRLSFSLHDGKAHSAVLWPPGSMVDTSFAAVVESSDLAVEAKRVQLSGGVKFRVLPQGAEKFKHYTLQIKAQMVGQRLAGNFAALDGGGKQVLTGMLHGTLTADEPPTHEQALYVLVLHDVPDSTYSQIYLRWSPDTKTFRGFGTTPDWNNATHPLTCTLVRQGNKISGDIALTVTPDPWIPKDHQVRAATFTIAGEVRDWQISGSYSGKFADTDVKGKVSGELQVGNEIRAPLRATVKIENGLIGGSDWQNRAFISFEVDAQGKIIPGGSVGNNHTKLSGKVDGGTFKWDPTGALAAEIELTVAPTDKPTAGKYKVVVTGGATCDRAGGTFQTYFDGKLVKSGTMWVMVKPAEGKK